MPSLASILLVVLIAASVLVACGCLAVVFWWKHVQNLYQDTYTKLTVEAVQILTVFAAIGGTYAAIEDKANWRPTAIAGAICFSLAKVTQIIADRKSKQLQADLQAQVEEWRRKAERAEAEGVNRTRLLTTLREPVRRKYLRVRSEVEQCALRKQGASIKHIRRSLACRQHIEDLLLSLALYFRAQGPQAEQAEHHYQFRIGLYVEVNRVMQPLYGVSSKDLNYDPFTSYRTIEHFFNLDTTAHASHTVRCVRDKQLIIVPDCAEAERRGQLVFFHPQQRTYLKSLAACYLGQMCSTKGGLGEAALVLDTDKAGFFKLEAETSLKLTVEEYSARLSLESGLLALTSIKGTKSHDKSKVIQPHGPGKESEATGQAEESSPKSDVP